MHGCGIAHVSANERKQAFEQTSYSGRFRPFAHGRATYVYLGSGHPRRRAPPRAVLTGVHSQITTAAVPGTLRHQSVDDLKEKASSWSIELSFVAVRGPEQLAPAFSDVTQVKAQALYVIEDPVFFAHRDAILTMASRARLPTLHELRRFPEKGALMSYGPDLYNLFRRALLTSTASLRAPSPPICLWNSLFSDLRREVGGQSVSSSR
jgi:hypothetical protein